MSARIVLLKAGGEQHLAFLTCVVLFSVMGSIFWVAFSAHPSLWGSAEGSGAALSMGGLRRGTRLPLEPRWSACFL